MSYMVINTMQREPHPPRGPGNPPSPKSRTAPAPGEGVREKRADGKAPSLRTPGSGLPATLLGGSRGVKGFKMCCLGPQVQVSTLPSQSATPHRWECGGHSPPPPQGVSQTWRLSVHSQVLLYRQGALPESQGDHYWGAGGGSVPWARHSAAAQ